MQDSIKRFLDAYEEEEACKKRKLEAEEASKHPKYRRLGSADPGLIELGDLKRVDVRAFKGKLLIDLRAYYEVNQHPCLVQKDCNHASGTSCLHPHITFIILPFLSSASSFLCTTLLHKHKLACSRIFTRGDTWDGSRDAWKHAF